MAPRSARTTPSSSLGGGGARAGPLGGDWRAREGDVSAPVAHLSFGRGGRAAWAAGRACQSGVDAGYAAAAAGARHGGGRRRTTAGKGKPRAASPGAATRRRAAHARRGASDAAAAGAPTRDAIAPGGHDFCCFRLPRHAMQKRTSTLKHAACAARYARDAHTACGLQLRVFYISYHPQSVP
jgi:hypothetical protein